MTQEHLTDEDAEARDKEMNDALIQARLEEYERTHPVRESLIERKRGRPKKEQKITVRELDDTPRVDEAAYLPLVEERDLEPLPYKESPSLVARSTTPTDPLLETSLSQNFEMDNNIKSVSKELFNKHEIELKTEVSHDEINNISRLVFLKEKFGISNIDVLTHSFLKLRVSKDRKSRTEFISALNTENRNAQGGNLMSRLLGMGGNNNGQ